MSRTSIRPPLVIELCGLPGAGKTYAAARLHEALVDLGVDARLDMARIAPEVPAPLRLTRKLARAGTQLALRPARAISAGRAIASGTSAPDAMHRYLQWLVAQEMLERARRGAGGVRVLDEGVVQALWSISLRRDPRSIVDVLRCARTGCTPDVIVVVDADVELAMARLDARPTHHSRTERLARAGRWAELVRGAELLEALIDASRDWVPPPAIVRIEGAARGGLDAVLALVRRQIDRARTLQVEARGRDL